MQLHCVNVGMSKRIYRDVEFLVSKGADPIGVKLYFTSRTKLKYVSGNCLFIILIKI